MSPWQGVGVWVTSLCAAGNYRAGAVLGTVLQQADWGPCGPCQLCCCMIVCCCLNQACCLPVLHYAVGVLSNFLPSGTTRQSLCSCALCSSVQEQSWPGQRGCLFAAAIAALRQPYQLHSLVQQCPVLC